MPVSLFVLAEALLNSHKAQCNPTQVQHAIWQGVENISKMQKDLVEKSNVENTLDYAEISTVNKIGNKAFPMHM